jgi:hypothetical protein
MVEAQDGGDKNDIDRDLRHQSSLSCKLWEPLKYTGIVTVIEHQGALVNRVIPLTS